MEYELIKTQKGVDMVVLDGYCFLKEKTMGKKTAWKCAEYKTCKCRSRCHTVNSEVVKPPNEHNHAADKGKILARKTIMSIKERAASSQESTDQIFAAMKAEVADGAVRQLPSVRNIKQAIQRIRREAKSGSFSTSSDLHSLVISDDNFLREFDNAPSQNRIDDSNMNTSGLTKGSLNGVPFHEKFEEVFLEPSLNIERKGKRKNIQYNSECEEIPHTKPLQHSCTHQVVRDEFSIYGEHVACKIRNLQNRRFQNIAEHKINNILFELDLRVSDEIDKLES